jgi:hypothetical protein
MAIPKAMQEKYDEISPLIAEFCDDRLNDEYKGLCLRLLEKLCRKRPSPLLSGREETWAAGIVYVICTNNYIFSKENPFRMSAAELAAPFGLSPNTASVKASEIRKLLRLSSLDNQWLLPQYQEHIDLENTPFQVRLFFERFRY